MNYLNMKSRYYVLLRVIVAVTCLLSHSMLFAQEGCDKLRAELDYMFQHIDKSKVPTGLLLDYAIEYEDLDLFDGNISRNPNQKVDNAIFSGILQTLKSASVKSEPLFENVRSQIKKLHQSQSESDIICGVSLFDYARIKGAALSKGLIRYEGGQVYNCASATESPYDIYEVFAACCLKTSIKGSYATFVLPEELVLTNTADIKDIEIDYGAGYKSIYPTGRVSGSLKTGLNTISFRLTRKNGSVLYSKSEIFVEEGTLKQSRSISIDPRFLPDDSLIVTGKSYRGIVTDSKIYIKYGLGHNSIKKPFIFVEGFNPSILDKTGMGESYISHAQMLYELYYAGYDCVYVDWKNSEEYIQANAYNLIEVIKKVNDLKDGDAKNVVMGHSMGGLITRYALCTMEQQEEPHQVSTFISYDAPHLGAHLSLGLLYGFYGLNKFIEDYDLLTSMLPSTDDGMSIEDLIGLGKCMAHSTAAQQMLVFYVDPLGNYNSYEHRIWQTELNNLGFPKGDKGATMNLLGISNSNYDTFTIPAHYMDIDFSASTDLGLFPFLSLAVRIVFHDVIAGMLTSLPGKTSIEGHFKLYPGKSQGDVVTDMKMKYKKKFLWLVNVSKNLFEYKKTFPNIPSYDKFPSSYYVSSFGLKEVDVDYSILGSLYFSPAIEDGFPFIPVSSALCCGDGLAINAVDYTDYNSSKSPFGENYFLKSNTSEYGLKAHGDIDMAALRWAISRINKTIYGPEVAQTGTKYTLSNVFGSVEWSTSDEKIATIDHDGIVTAKGKGFVTISAKDMNDYTYSKTVMIGMPRFVISASHQPGGYRVDARCIDSQYSDGLQSVKDAMVYLWGIKFPEKDIHWITTNDPAVMVPLESGEDKVLVYFKTLDVLGNESPVQSIEVNSTDIYYPDASNLRITTGDKLYRPNDTYCYYKNGMIRFNYIPDVDESYKTRLWAILGAKVFSPVSDMRKISISGSGFPVNGILPIEEYQSIQQLSDDGENHIYLLALINSRNEIIQYVPITFTYKENI